MARRGYSTGSTSVGDALGLVIASAFSTFQIIFALVIGLPIAFLLYDIWFTQEIVPEDQYILEYSEPRLNEMGGGRPANIAPLFDYDWEFVNNSPYLIQTFQMNGELFRCDTPTQPLNTCDYVMRQNSLVTINLPAGARTSERDQFSFTSSTRKPGYMRARIWASEATADTDKEY